VSPTDTELWATGWLAAEAATKHAQLAIQRLATLTEGDADMKLVFAACGLQGTLALLREADAAHRQLDLPLPEAPL
jgi:hypothetical protein